MSKELVFPEGSTVNRIFTEKDELVTNYDRFNSLRHSSPNPYAFTGQGVAMLSAVLRSAIAVKVLPLTKHIDKRLTLDIKKANKQYGGFEIKNFGQSHDLFLIIDAKEMYHLGASLKDLGKKPVVSEAEPWFAFSKMDKSSVENIINVILEWI